MKIQKKWFTLIEMLISISIFSIMMVSIISVYFVSTDITYKSYINRIIHENTKNVVVTISEDVMKNNIEWVSESLIYSDCTLPNVDENFKEWDKFCVWNSSEYYLAVKSTFWDSYNRVGSDFCKDKTNQCFILKNGKPLTNNLVRVTDLKFFVTNKDIRKVTMILTLKPLIESWVKSWMMDSTKLTTQITLSERKYKN